MPLNVLVVARWYPSHDEPGRGTFVADQVRALADAGVGIVVACPEPALFTPAVGSGPPDHDRLAPWIAAISERGALGRPRRWGAPGVPVVRIPAARPTGRGRQADPADVAELQTRSLLPIGLGIARTWRVDLVHAHTGLPDGSSAAVLADRLGVPLVVTEHESALPTRLASERARIGLPRALRSRSTSGRRQRDPRS